MGNQDLKNLHQQPFYSTHPQFQNAQSVLTEDHQKFIQAKYKIQNRQYDEWKNNLEGKILRFKSEYLLLPQKMHYKHEEGLCGNTGTLTVHYQQFQETLADLIKSRQSTRSFFKEGQLWYLLYVLTASREDLKADGYNIGDIRPQNIFVQKDGKLKIGSKHSYPNELENYIKVIDINSSSEVYLLAPQQFTYQKDTKNFTRAKAEIYSIGATIICAGNLDNFNSVYKNRNSFELANFNEKKRAWVNNNAYTPIFKSIILSLIDENVNERLNQQQLWSFISEHKKSILQKVEFILYKVPLKVQTNFNNLKQYS